MRSICREGTLGGAVSHSSELLRRLKDVVPFANEPAMYGVAPNAYLRGLQPGFGPHATVRGLP